MNNLCKKLQSLGIKLTDEPQINGSFVLSNGLFLSLQENRFLLSRGFNKEATHKDFAIFMFKNGFNKSAKSDNVLGQYNAIRTNTGDYFFGNETTFIDLPENPLSAEQYNALLKWLDFVCFSLKKNVLYLGKPSQHRSIEYDLTIEDAPLFIIKEIKKIYATSKEN